MYEDIPEARRQTVPEVSQPRFNLAILLWGITAIAVLASGLWLSAQLFAPRSQQPTDKLSKGAAAMPTAAIAPLPVPKTSAVPAQDPKPDTLLGHLPYAEAPQSELRPIVADGSIKLRAAAATAYKAMVAAAQADGVSLVPISGFRSIQDQNHLFFDVKAERGQVATQRAQVSAPPGYSEHHTGYAVDIGDGSRPEMNLNPSFDQTAAFHWLKANAAHFSFELSFAKNNPQGVNYEPWHWRYVGDQQSLQTFYNAKHLKPDR